MVESVSQLEVGPWRRFCRYIVVQKWFENLVLLVILANMIVMMIDDPRDDPESHKQAIIKGTDMIFTVLFAIECCVKMTALGLWHRNYVPQKSILKTMDQSDLAKGVGYFQNNWNVLDFVIVIESVVSSFYDGSTNISGLRTFRVLRPLRAINKLPGLKLLINSIIDSIPLLLNTLFGFILFFLIFAILGVQLWMGLFNNRCFDNLTDALAEDPIIRLCNPDGGMHKCGATETCKPLFTSPNRGPEEAFGPSFNHFVWALLTVFQCITLEGWSDIMYNTQDIENNATVLYFVPLVLSGAFILLNLVLAVIVYRFNEASNIFTKEQNFRKMKRYMHLFKDKRVEKNHLRSAFHVWNEFVVAENTARERRSMIERQAQIAVQAISSASEQIARLVRRSSGEATVPSSFAMRRKSKKASPMNNARKIIPVGEDAQEKSSSGTRTMGSMMYSVGNSIGNMAAGAKSVVVKASREAGKAANSILEEPDLAAISVRRKKARQVPKGGIAWLWWKIRQFFRECSHETHIFSKLMLGCIVLNTAVLAMDHHGMSDFISDFVQGANNAFFVIFATEMGIKVIGLGPVGYLRDRFNVFDGTIVLISAAEISIGADNTSGGGGTSSSSAFRTVRIFRLFRVLRIAKLARHLKFLQQMMKVIGESIASVAYAFLLLVLFIVIFSILGVQLFAGKLPTSADARNNFNGILMSIVTVFQCLTGEEWNIIMYNSMHATSNGAAVYYVIWIIVGKFVLLPVFLAVLLRRDETAQRPAIARSKRSRRGLLSRSKSKVRKAKGQLYKTIDKITHHKTSPKAVDKTPTLGDDHDVKEEGVAQDCFGVCGAISRLMNRFKIPATCRKIVADQRFENGVLFLIFLSAIALATETPGTENNQQQKDVLRVLEIIFTTLFSMEVLVKVSAIGWCKYLSDGWNLVDLTVVASSLINLILESMLASVDELAAVRILRLVRALRPLRVISRNKGMKLVVNALINSMWPMLSVISVLLLLWLMFAIVGVQLYGGKFYYCTDPAFPPNTHSSACVGAFTDTGGVVRQREWVNAKLNFDNSITAMLTLFTMSSLEGWPQIMWRAIDATEVDYSPRRDNQPIMSLYFIFFLVLGSFFFLNLFVLTIFTNFISQKKFMEGDYLLTAEQRKWLKMQKRLMITHAEVRQKAPQQPFRRWCYKIVNRGWFDKGIMILIGLNIFCMALTHQGETQDFRQILDVINIVFVVIYVIEAGLKMNGFGVRKYFDDGWNRFDFSLVVISLLDLFLLIVDIEIKGGPTLLRVLRLTRLARILRVAKNAEGLRKTFMTIYLSLPSMMNVGALLLLLFFVFGVLGVNLFGKVEQDGKVFNEHTHFQNVGMAVLTLFRCSTGEGWDKIMLAAADADRGGTRASYSYFICFLTLSTHIVLNLFVMVLVDNFDQVFRENDEATKGMSEQELEEFKYAWSTIDPEGTGRAPVYRVIAVLRDLMPPLGVGMNANFMELSAYLQELDMNCFKGTIEYHPLLYGVHKVGYAGVMSLETEKLLVGAKYTLFSIHDHHEHKRHTLSVNLGPLKAAMKFRNMRKKLKDMKRNVSVHSSEKIIPITSNELPGEKADDNSLVVSMSVDVGTGSGDSEDGNRNGDTKNDSNLDTQDDRNLDAKKKADMQAESFSQRFVTFDSSPTNPTSPNARDKFRRMSSLHRPRWTTMHTNVYDPTLMHRSRRSLQIESADERKLLSNFGSDSKDVRCQTGVIEEVAAYFVQQNWRASRFRRLVRRVVRMTSEQQKLQQQDQPLAGAGVGGTAVPAASNSENEENPTAPAQIATASVATEATADEGSGENAD